MLYFPRNKKTALCIPKYLHPFPFWNLKDLLISFGLFHGESSYPAQIWKSENHSGLSMWISFGYLLRCGHLPHFSKSLKSNRVSMRQHAKVKCGRRQQKGAKSGDWICLFNVSCKYLYSIWWFDSLYMGKHGKWLFHQTSIKTWLFGVPGTSYIHPKRFLIAEVPLLWPIFASRTSTTPQKLTWQWNTILGDTSTHSWLVFQRVMSLFPGCFLPYSAMGSYYQLQLDHRFGATQWLSATETNV